MKGDYYRYMAEYKKGEEKKDVSEKSLIEYNKALEEAEVLNSTDTIKLGLALNFSVFYYEIISDHHKAIELAQKALDDARNNIDQMEDADYKDATLILQLLSDNLNLWKNGKLTEENRIETLKSEMTVLNPKFNQICPRIAKFRHFFGPQL